MQRETPVTGLPTQEMVSLIGIAAASERGHAPRRRRRGDRHQRLPLRAGARPRAARPSGSPRPGFGERRRRADPRARPDRDAQPARPRHALRRHRQRPRRRATSSSIVERSMSAPVYELLKRPDELLRRRARAPAAALRRGLGARRARGDARARTPSWPTTTSCFSRQVNLETIHDHDVLAERYGTVGELRGELDAATRPERHTELESGSADDADHGARDRGHGHRPRPPVERDRPERQPQHVPGRRRPRSPRSARDQLRARPRVSPTGSTTRAARSSGAATARWPSTTGRAQATQGLTMAPLERELLAASCDQRRARAAAAFSSAPRT